MSDTEQTTVPPPEPPAGRRRLTRSRSDRVLTGVAGGLAEYFGVDAVVFRIGFVAASLLGGFGLLVYGLAWLLVPEEGARRTLGEHLLRQTAKCLHHVSWPTVAGIVLLVTAAAILIDTAAEAGGGDIVLSALLIIGGIGLLAWQPPSRPRASDSPATDTAATAATSESAAGPAEPAPSGPRPLALTRPTLSVLFLAGGAIGLADAADLIDVTGEEFLAGSLAFVGLVLIVSTWWGRARGLLVVGALLTLALGGLTAVDVPLSAGFGERTYRPHEVSDVREQYRLFAGEMLLDLSDVDFPEGTAEIDAELAFGELHVIVPPRSAVVVDAEAEGGELRILGETEDGVGADITRRTRGRDRDGSTLRLDLHVIGGEIEVSNGTS